jgi:hypothetical protein
LGKKYLPTKLTLINRSQSAVAGELCLDTPNVNKPDAT